MEKGMAMPIVESRAVIGGVDTHLDAHVATALDGIGGLLGVQEFPATLPGYQALLGWLGGFGSSTASESKAPAPMGPA
jgi:transposase